MSIQVSTAPPTLTKPGKVDRVAYLADLLAQRPTLQPAAADVQTWLQGMRDQAVSQLEGRSIPSMRDEDWRFTNLSDLIQTSFTLAPPTTVTLSDIEAYRLPEADRTRVVFVNGVYAPALSDLSGLPAGIHIGHLSDSTLDQVQSYVAQIPGSEELFTALNTASFTDAAILSIPKNQTIATPIHLLWISTTGDSPSMNSPRCLVVAGSSSSTTVIEDYVSLTEGVYFTNAVTEIWVAENAQVNHTRIQRDSKVAFHIGKTAVSQARDSRYTCNTIHFGASLSRHHLEIYQTGEQTETYLNGLTLIQGEQVSDTHSAIALTKPHNLSRQLQKNIVADRAHAIFNGRVCVAQAAQLTDAGQLNRNLLLSSKARVDTKPQLEIVADNVKCTHGATVGQLDADEIFYLQSRGIDAVSARNLLIYAFAYDVIEKIPVESLQKTLLRFVSRH